MSKTITGFGLILTAVAAYMSGIAWLAFGLIIVALFVFATKEQKIEMPQTVSAAAEQKKKEEEYSPYGPKLDPDDFTLSIATPCDAIGSMKAMSPKGNPKDPFGYHPKTGIGARTGTYTIDHGIIRIKDDIRINLDVLHAEAARLGATTYPKGINTPYGWIKQDPNNTMGRCFRFAFRRKNKEKLFDTALKQKTFEQIKYPGFLWD
jgi:hypothetical protein